MISRQKKLSILAFRFGLLGLVGHLLGLTSAALGFEDFNGHGFSLFNFSLSELGQYGLSDLAVVFNGGLFFGSLSLVLFCLFSLQNADSTWLYSVFAVLVLSLFSLAVTGLFPVNVYHLHTLGIEYFFYFSFVAIALYIGYLLQPPFGVKMFSCTGSLLLSLLTLVCMGAFILLAHFDISMVANGRWFYHDFIMIEPRPEYWWPVMLEWLSLGLFLLWVCSLVLSQRAFRRRKT